MQVSLGLTVILTLQKTVTTCRTQQTGLSEIISLWKPVAHINDSEWGWQLPNC